MQRGPGGWLVVVPYTLLGLACRLIPNYSAQATCCIVSRTSNAHFDAYVLSESSLFVYADRLVLKTCGTTRLLDAVPALLDLAAGLAVEARRCKYSRASFLFPEHQVRAVFMCVTREHSIVELFTEVLLRCLVLPPTSQGCTAASLATFCQRLRHSVRHNY